MLVLEVLLCVVLNKILGPLCRRRNTEGMTNMVNIKTNTEKYRVVVVLASYADHVDKCFRNLAAFVDAA